jgi:hypothetical protein
MFRSLLTALLRACERSPLLFGAFAVAAAALGFLHNELAAAFGSSSSAWVGRTAFALTVLASVPVAIRDTNI